MPGSTAYGGLVHVLRPKEGETLFVSGAAGAVGGLVGQIAKKVYKCRVIGSCGGEEKCRLVKERFSFDAAVDYKKASTQEELTSLLRDASGGQGPASGVDMYFENVGGIHFEAAMNCLRVGGRVAVCGTISSYNDKDIQYVPLNLGAMIYTQQRIEGFLSRPYLTGKIGNFLETMKGWMSAGLLEIEETTFRGLDQWPLGFQSLFTGGNTGKVVVFV